MKKQSKAKAAGVKPDAGKGKPKAAKKQAAKVAADKGKGTKPAKDKPDEFRFTVGGEVYKVSSTATVGELLKAVVIGLVKLSEQVESVRRTLWRMSEIREYKGAGDKPDAGKGGEK